jgi:AraC-like DNA-binding protein
LRSEKKLRNVFSELYEIQDSARIDYLRIKVVELLVLLSLIELERISQHKTYYKKTHVQKVHQIKDYLCETIDRKTTLKQLAGQFDIPLSILTSCFRSMFGQSIYAFLKHYRLQKAAQLLRTTELSITQIALEVGYQNPSKFISAFKQEFSVTPLQAKKVSDKMEYF